MVESRGCLRTCREVLGVNLLQDPDQDVIAQVKEFGHGGNVTERGLKCG
jgi:hypothetical protein